jgi:hypothetical protein
MWRLCIISGGQTGVDRAALDVALALSIPYDGWSPRGGWAEDLTEPPGVLAKYPLLRETPLPDPAQRTEWNVRDSDAALILTDHAGLAASNGTALAHQLAERHARPLLLIGLDQPNAAARTAQWLADRLAGASANAPVRLGIGGPRESEAPGIYRRAAEFLHALLPRAR